MTDPERDPFGERRKLLGTRRHRVLGADIVFSSESRELLELVDEAFAGGPPHRVGRRVRELSLHLRLSGSGARRPAFPPQMRFDAGGGLLHGGFDRETFATLSPERGSGMIVISRAVLSHRDLVRYELLEFAALTLAARSLDLVPLHAACIASGDRGVLVFGDSGAGKSTLSLLAALDGLGIVGEDNVFVEPSSLRASGHATRLYARPGTLALLPPKLRRELARSPTIRRRSGAIKHMLDARRLGAHARRMPRIVGVLYLTGRAIRSGRPCASVPVRELRRLLRRTQPYAAWQPGWSRFEGALAKLPALSMNRTSPADSIAVVRRMLAGERR